MNDPASERIAVTFNPTADDYARYAASVDRRRRSWSAFNIFVAIFFGAIPVALLFRWLAAQRLDDAQAIEMAGQHSLFAFALGVVASIIGTFLISRISRKRYFATTVNSDEPRTVELDRSGVTITGKTSQSRWQWTAVSRCTRERSLLLIWVAPFAAVVIPSRSFASEAACAAAHAFVRARLTEASATMPQPEPRIEQRDPEPRH